MIFIFIVLNKIFKSSTSILYRGSSQILETEPWKRSHIFQCKVSIRAFISLPVTGMCKMTPAGAWDQIFILSPLRRGKLPLQSDQVQSGLLKWNSRTERGLRAHKPDYPPSAGERWHPGKLCSWLSAIRFQIFPLKKQCSTWDNTHYQFSQYAQTWLRERKPPNQHSSLLPDLIDFELSLYCVKVEPNKEARQSRQR